VKRRFQLFSELELFSCFDPPNGASAARIFLRVSDSNTPSNYLGTAHMETKHVMDPLDQELKSAGHFKMGHSAQVSFSHRAMALGCGIPANFDPPILHMNQLNLFIEQKLGPLLLDGPYGGENNNNNKY